MRLPFLLFAACSSERVYTLDDLPIETWTAGLPVTGDGRLDVWLAPAHPHDWSRAVGFVRFRCDGCTLGDDRTPFGFPLFDDPHGIYFGHITFDRVRAALAFADGRMTLTSSWRSPDLELDARITGVLAPRAGDIALAGCIVFRPTDALLARDARTHAAIATTGAPIDAEGRYTIRIDGTVGRMRKLGQACALP